ncbi:MAG: biopolymer transporter ExbD [Sutterellaceae bacterium]|nr:biopolymer transporter ExbD [Sutterellaceae bacterium]
MRIRKNQEDAGSAGIDMTPIIDIVFIMLIFFVLTASFQNQQSIRVERPVAQTTDQSEKETVIVTVDKSSMIWIDNRTVAKAQLSSAVRALVGGKKTSVIVNADKSISSGTLIEVIDQIRIAGVAHVAVATKTGD